MSLSLKDSATGFPSAPGADLAFSLQEYRSGVAGGSYGGAAVDGSDGEVVGEARVEHRQSAGHRQRQRLHVPADLLPRIGRGGRQMSLLIGEELELDDGRSTGGTR